MRQLSIENKLWPFMHLGGKKQAETPKYKRKKETEAEVLALFPTMLPGSLWECTEEELPVQDLLQITPSQLDSLSALNSAPQADFKPGNPG